MRAIIIAGGRGTRLRPHTEEVPKCLLKVGPYAILDYQFEALRACGITDVAIVTGHFGSKIREYCFGRSITFIENPKYEETNSTYGAWLAKDFALESADGFLLMNSDLILSAVMLRALIDSPAPLAIMIDRKRSDANDMVKAKMEGDRIIDMSKTLPAEEAVADVTGPIKFSRAVGRDFFAFAEAAIQKGDLTQWSFYTLRDFAARTPLIGVENPGQAWAEVDTPEDLEIANRNIPPTYMYDNDR